MEEGEHFTAEDNSGSKARQRLTFSREEVLACALQDVIVKAGNETNCGPIWNLRRGRKGKKENKVKEMHGVRNNLSQRMKNRKDSSCFGTREEKGKDSQLLVLYLPCAIYLYIYLAISWQRPA